MKKREQYRSLIRNIFTIALWGALTFVWVHVWWRYYADAIAQPFYYRGNWLVIAIYGLLLFQFIRFYGGYHIGYYKRGSVIYSGLLGLLICNFITYLQISLLGLGFLDVRPMLVMTILQAAVTAVLVMAAHKIYLHIFSPRELLMVYGGEDQTDNLLSKLSAYPENFAVSDKISITEEYDDVTNLISQYSDVFLCDIPSDLRNPLLKFCYDLGIRTYTTPKITDILLRGASEVRLFDTPLLFIRSAGLSIEQRFIKRLTDIVLSGAGLIIAVPFMLVIALAVKLCDRGPVIYKQQRLTRDGELFWLYKIRSMKPHLDSNAEAHPAVKGDDRITPVGKIIRAYRLDELPQLWNIIRGDMSIVGPRPEQPKLAKAYSAKMPEFAYRLRVKAGLTGLAQTAGRYNTTAYDKLRLDLSYIANYSLTQDFKLMLMTLKVLFERKRTEGMSERMIM